ncbi:cytochrome P450 [Solwaraspora sp. WMMD1047]|uniref:cytochrome P450 family protein n=1 Tax=Solwaraspora sp. WMMD1047 TaxID=3016102 RepID=UPI0024166B9A|nr:cytochrome P450 [Solwaraspora sp. WMMD1047]MDG4830831.1 cytochrome P450 [Solwaraspora sp. WMMD1047]
MTTAVEPTAPAVPDDPYPTLAALRAAGPVTLIHTAEGLPVWLVTGYHEVRAALADPRFGQDGPRAQALADQRVTGVDVGAGIVHMLNSDPPDHTRLRRVMTGTFSAGRVAALRPAIVRAADDLLDAMAAGTGPVDLIGTYAFPLPLAVICDLLGVPPGDRSTFRDWSTALVTHGEPGVAAKATAQLREYLTGQLARRRVAPADDLLTDLLRAQDAGRLDHDEVLSMAILLLIAGHETTVSLIGNATLQLLREPGLRAGVLADPTRLPATIEELLRLESPVAMATLRFTREPVRLGGVDLPAGEFVLLAIGAANRDPARFADPDRPDLTRGATGHLAFGHGAHRCLGAALARLEGEVALGRLFARFPQLRLADVAAGLRWRDTPMLRGLETLPVELAG